MHKVAVVMSTYNGEKYLAEQLNSILAQKDIDTHIFIRDDGSRDNTRLILKQYSDNYDNIHVIFGENCGFRRSFILALEMTGCFDYYAFCDQDDFWEKEKLSAACAMLGKCTGPCVYYSNLKVTDENLNVYRITHLEKRKKSMESMVIRRSIAGCTIVFNQVLKDRLFEAQITDDLLCRGHDGLILSLCYAIGGKVICDSKSYIRYRQHGNNTSGSTNSIRKRIKKEWNMFIHRKGMEPRVARAILDNWNISDKQTRKSLEMTGKCDRNIICRLKIVFSRKFTTGDIRLTVLGKFKVLVGLI